MRTWPSTPGVVSGSGLRDQRLEDGRQAQYAETGFRYVVNGHTYGLTTSNYAGLGNTGGNGHRLGFAANAPVTIYYDPDDPSHASLTNERPSLTVVLTLIAVVCYLFSLPLGYLSVRMFRASRAS